MVRGFTPGLVGEKSGRILLERVENYCPLNPGAEKSGATGTELWEPLFKGYVFCKDTEEKMGQKKNRWYYKLRTLVREGLPK